MVVRAARETRVREQCDAFRAAAFNRQVDKSSGDLTDGFLIISDVCFKISMLCRVYNIWSKGLASMFVCVFYIKQDCYIYFNAKRCGLEQTWRTHIIERNSSSLSVFTWKHVYILL